MVFSSNKLTDHLAIKKQEMFLDASRAALYNALEETVVKALV